MVKPTSLHNVDVLIAMTTTLNVAAAFWKPFFLNDLIYQIYIHNIPRTRLMRIVFWGTYDTGKPRVRILKHGLKEAGAEVLECHRDVWEDVEDKSQIKGLKNRAAKLFKWLLSYPGLIWQYLKMPKHDAVIIGYLGHLDVLIIWPIAKLRGVPVLWDAFLSLYNTVVEDRKLLRSSHPLSKILFSWEWIACRVASLVILDTRAHAEYFARSFNFPIEHTEAIFVGSEPDIFPVLSCSDTSAKRKRTVVLFYGQFIPLHGIETIIQAAKISKGEAIRWIIIGKGQQERKIRKMLEDEKLPHLEWIPWVSYVELTHWIRKADVCLGIFGDTSKASRVIPNKVFQILMSGKPLITRDSPAIRELLTPEMKGIHLIPPADANALASAVKSISRSTVHGPLHSEIRKRIEPTAIGSQLQLAIKRIKSEFV